MVSRFTLSLILLIATCACVQDTYNTEELIELSEEKITNHKEDLLRGMGVLDSLLKDSCSVYFLMISSNTTFLDLSKFSVPGFEGSSGQRAVFLNEESKSAIRNSYPRKNFNNALYKKGSYFCNSMNRIRSESLKRARLIYVWDWDDFSNDYSYFYFITDEKKQLQNQDGSNENWIFILDKNWGLTTSPPPLLDADLNCP